MCSPLFINFNCISTRETREQIYESSGVEQTAWNSRILNSRVFSIRKFISTRGETNFGRPPILLLGNQLRKRGASFISAANFPSSRGGVEPGVAVSAVTARTGMLHPLNTNKMLAPEGSRKLIKRLASLLSIHQQRIRIIRNVVVRASKGGRILDEKLTPRPSLLPVSGHRILSAKCRSDWKTNFTGSSKRIELKYTAGPISKYRNEICRDLLFDNNRERKRQKFDKN